MLAVDWTTSRGPASVLVRSRDFSGRGAGCLTPRVGSDRSLERVGARAVSRSALFFWSSGSSGREAGKIGIPSAATRKRRSLVGRYWLWLEIREWLRFWLSPSQPPFVSLRKLKPPKESYSLMGRR